MRRIREPAPRRRRRRLGPLLSLAVALGCRGCCRFRSRRISASAPARAALGAAAAAASFVPVPVPARPPRPNRRRPTHRRAAAAGAGPAAATSSALAGRGAPPSPPSPSLFRRLAACRAAVSVRGEGRSPRWGAAAGRFLRPRRPGGEGVAPPGARYSDYADEDDDGWSSRSAGRVRGGKRSKKKKTKKKKSDPEDEYWDEHWDEDEDRPGDDPARDAADDAATTDGAVGGDDYNSRVRRALSDLRASASASLDAERWTPSRLDAERSAPRSCWRYRSSLRDAVDRVSAGLVERDEEARLVVLGLVSGEHVLLLGPPGTGKSVLGRRLSALCCGSFFQRLLTRFTTPEELFGPLSLRALENDEYRRCTAGFLPTADVAFLDEIFKANSAILNALLTILNERRFDNGAGGVREVCPVRCVVGASNELPESEELDALYDRFLLRKEVAPVSDEGLVRLLSTPAAGDAPARGGDGGDDGDDGGNPPEECNVAFADGLDRIVRSLSEAADEVAVGDDALSLIRDLRAHLRDDLDVDLSDRRLVRAARLLRISAASHGRSVVDPIDCLLLEHVAWGAPEQRGAVRDFLWDHLTPGGGGGFGGRGASEDASRFRLLLDGLRRESIDAARRTGGDLTGAAGARPADASVLASLRSEAARLASLLRSRSDSLARHAELLRGAPDDHLWIGADEARAARQILLPRAVAAAEAVDRALGDALALEGALGTGDGGAAASPEDGLCVSVLEGLWEEGGDAGEASFTEDELGMDMREAKAKYDTETFRRWKRARKKAK